ncbi:MAG: hypothetical protein AB7J35_16925 [Dehalococcoidia bacterium]
MRRWVGVCAAALAVAVFVFVGAHGAEADDGSAVEAAAVDLGVEHVPGFDISWPQCPDGVFPPGPVAFAVIGVNNGKPYTSNPCFREQFAWANRVEQTPAVYVNTAFPKPGDPEALHGPYGACAEDDGWCRGYNYGWNMAADVVRRADMQGVTPSHWWLDVEGSNFWSGEPNDNSQVIRAAVDYFKARRLPVGIYGTPYMWNNIAGQIWKSPGIPIWTAGASGLAGAASRCNPGYAFAGGTVAMVQYYDFGFDTNYICPGTEAIFKHPVPHPLISGPRGRTTSYLGSQLGYWHIIPMVAN